MIKASKNNIVRDKLVESMANEGTRRFIDRIEYLFEHPEDEDSLYAMFSLEERNILRTIQEFEQMRKCTEGQEKIRNDKERDVDKFTERVFREREKERDISFQLKEEIIEQINQLLKKGKTEDWLDILAWYQLLKGKNLIINKFWEFPVLSTMLKAFKKELVLYCSEGSPISVLALHTLNELTDSYFEIVFMLRRIEYDVEPINELEYYMLKEKLSLSVVKTVLEEARIFDKRKVQRIIDNWVGNGNG